MTRTSCTGHTATPPRDTLYALAFCLTAAPSLVLFVGAWFGHADLGRGFVGTGDPLRVLLAGLALLWMLPMTLYVLGALAALRSRATRHGVMIDLRRSTIAVLLTIIVMPTTVLLPDWEALSSFGPAGVLAIVGIILGVVLTAIAGLVTVVAPIGVLFVTVTDVRRAGTSRRCLLKTRLGLLAVVLAAVCALVLAFPTGVLGEAGDLEPLSLALLGTPVFFAALSAGLLILLGGVRRATDPDADSAR